MQLDVKTYTAESSDAPVARALASEKEMDIEVGTSITVKALGSTVRPAGSTLQGSPNMSVDSAEGAFLVKMENEVHNADQGRERRIYCICATFDSMPRGGT